MDSFTKRSIKILTFMKEFAKTLRNFSFRIQKIQKNFWGYNLKRLCVALVYHLIMAYSALRLLIQVTKGINISHVSLLFNNWKKFSIH